MRLLSLVYAAIGYVLAMVATLYLLGFIAGVGVPKAINDGPIGPLWLAVAVDLGLIGLFGLHHSMMARRRFKARWTRVVAPAIERATYLYLTALMTLVLVLLWRPIPLTLWEVDSALAAGLLRGLFLGVTAGMVLTTFQLGHFRFFGLAQAWEQLVGRTPPAGSLSTRWLYAVVRHPISLGWMLLPWLVPHVTVGQALFALGMTVYILLATPFEEADLEAELGAGYRAYRHRVAAFLPLPSRFVPDIFPEVDDGIW